MGGTTINPIMKINLSKTLEKSLKQIIESQKSAFLGEVSFGKEGSVELRVGFEPAFVLSNFF